MYTTFVPAECPKYYTVTSYKKQWETLTTDTFEEQYLKINVLENYKVNCEQFVEQTQQELLCWLGLALGEKGTFKRTKKGEKVSKLYPNTQNGIERNMKQLSNRIKHIYSKHIRYIWKNRIEIGQMSQHPLSSIFKNIDKKLMEMAEYDEENPLLTILEERDVGCIALIMMSSLLKLGDTLFRSLDEIQQEYDEIFEIETEHWPNGRTIKQIKVEQFKHSLFVEIESLKRQVEYHSAFGNRIDSFYITVNEGIHLKKMHGRVIESGLVPMDNVEPNNGYIYSKYKYISNDLRRLEEMNGHTIEHLREELSTVGIYFVKIRWGALTALSEKMEWLSAAYPTRYSVNSDGTFGVCSKYSNSDGEKSEYYYKMNELFDDDKYWSSLTRNQSADLRNNYDDDREFYRELERRNTEHVDTWSKTGN